MFLGQMSIFKIINRKIYLDFTSEDLSSNDNFSLLTTPHQVPVTSNAAVDFMRITSGNSVEVGLRVESRADFFDQEFIEGNRRRITHLKIERSPLLRKMFFEVNPTTVCDMCTLDVKKRYSWTNNLLEIHHILPLSASLGFEQRGTSLSDVVPLCPSCHRSVHSYYRSWFKTSSFDDFTDKQHAAQVYQEAKSKIL